MTSRFASFLSYLFHPIFLPLICVFILFQLPVYYNYRFNAGYFNAVYLFLFINLVFVPLGGILYMKNKGIINSYEMTTAKERRIPFLFSALLYILTFFVLNSMGFPDLYLKIFKSITATLIILCMLLFANVKWSAHLSAMGGLLGMLIVISKGFGLNLTGLLIPVILMSGLLASSRLALNAHSLKETFFGFLLGLGLQLSLLIEL